MHKKYFLSSLLGLALSLGAFAQNNPGADYLALGEKEMARDYFMKTMRQQPAESFYYLGRLAIEEGNLAEAKSNFEKGLNSNPESALCAIGLASLELKNDPKEAGKELDRIKKKHKKEVTVLLEVARAYYENGLADKGQAVLNDARKADKKSPHIYIFEGDLVKDQDAGKASAQYEQAINFDEKCVLAYIKYARVYKNIQPKVAIDKMKAVLAMDPSNALVKKNLADLYFSKGFYPEAISAYTDYMQAGSYSIDDITNLAASQFFTDDYTSAVKTINEGLGKDSQHFVLNRLAMYSENALKDYEKGAETASVFFSIPRDTARYIERDHMTYANILTHLGRKAEAVTQYDKAIELVAEDENFNIDLYKNVATLCANENMYEEAGDFYKKYIAKKGEAVEATDFYQAGNYYYRAGDAARRDTLLADRASEILDKADAEFAVVTERMPDVPLGYLMRARVNASKDPETTQGLAKPHYESLVDVVLKEAEGTESAEDRTTELKEAYSYLSYYYYLQFADKNSKEAKAKAKDFVDRLLEIDPSNGIASQLKPALQ